MFIILSLVRECHTEPKGLAQTARRRFAALPFCKLSFILFQVVRSTDRLLPFVGAVPFMSFLPLFGVNVGSSTDF